MDRDLGMDRKITRRDLLHGAAVTAAGAAAATGYAKSAGGVYPPARTGLRGSHDGAFEEAHRLAMTPDPDWGEPSADTDPYDLVVVGGGISGLSAAYFYRQQQPDARILILENHDDFGGHAKRNEFTVDGRTLIGYGGSQSLEAPGDYSETASTLLRELTVDTERFYELYDQSFYARHGLTTGIYFDKATYGRDAYVHTADLFSSPLLGFAQPQLDTAAMLAAMPLSEEARRQLHQLVTVREDRLPDIGVSDVAGYLSSISYERFLKQHAGVTAAELLTLLRRMPSGYFGLGTDAVPALEAMLFGLPGLNKSGVPGAQWLARQAAEALVEPYIFHFPDGNATVARLLVRSLIPEISSERDAERLVLARFDYSQLDRPQHNVQLRLNSTAINVANTAAGVDVTYRTAAAGRMATRKVAARHCVLACYNMMIPHLCPELPLAQRQALAEAVKVPLVYSNVVLRNWRALQAKGAGFAFTPSAFHAYCMVDFPVSMGGYDFARSPDEPIALHFSEALIEPGLAPKDQHRVGRARLLATPFTTIERDLRQTLAGMLGDAGFDPAADIAAITVNRWPHGYAYTPSYLDPVYAPGEAPHEIGRRTRGNIAIANSDAGARAYLDEAIDQASRAVGELLAG